MLIILPLVIFVTLCYILVANKSNKEVTPYVQRRKEIKIRKRDLRSK